MPYMGIYGMAQTSHGYCSTWLLAAFTVNGLRLVTCPPFNIIILLLVSAQVRSGGWRSLSSHTFSKTSNSET